MEPQIQYAQTADGVSIAFWTLGEGPPLVSMPDVPWSHIQMEWHIPDVRRWYERLTRKRKLVRYDARGSGLSERDVVDFSVDNYMLDLEAVVDQLNLEKFALFTFTNGGPAAISYAARHPERVSHLALWHCYASASDYFGASPQLQAARSLLDKDWEVYTETLVHAAFGWSSGELARQYAAFLRESVDQETALACYAAAREFDVTNQLPQVTCPTLVLHRRQAPFPHVSAARDLASRMPNARLRLMEGASLAPSIGDMEAVLAAIDEFLGEGEEPTAPAAAPTGLVTILFTDMESSTALTQRLGDAKAQELVRAHNAIVRDALKAHGGSEIKHTGDGIMASFPSASGAIECTVAIQRAVAAHVDEHPETPLGVHIGLNAGEPVAEEQDLFGTAVQLARRICDHAEPGQILAPIVVRELAAGKGFLFADIGETALRGFEDPVRLYEVRWEA